MQQVLIELLVHAHLFLATGDESVNKTGTIPCPHKTYIRVYVAGEGNESRQ